MAEFAEGWLALGRKLWVEDRAEVCRVALMERLLAHADTNLVA
jgi:hypothetical protein